MQLNPTEVRVVINLARLEVPEACAFKSADKFRIVVPPW